MEIELLKFYELNEEGKRMLATNEICVVQKSNIANLFIVLYHDIYGNSVKSYIRDSVIKRIVNN
jgi:hypothetical protein